MPNPRVPRVCRASHLDEGTLAAYTHLGIQPIEVEDITTTLAAMVQHAACHLGEDFLRALRFGMEREESETGRSIYSQLLQNAHAASGAGRATCQDTGQAVVFVDVGQDVRIIGGTLEEAVDAGVRAGYRTFRKSVVHDALFDRSNRGDNTPAVVHVRLVPGHTISLHLAEKGYGSENKSLMTMYPYPQGGEEALVQVVCAHISQAGAGWCPPGVLSVAVGGNFESAPLMAKRALLQPFDMDLLLERAAHDPQGLDRHERLRVRLFEAVNRLGIGPQGLGGTTTVLDVKLTTAPTHIAGMPIAINVQCNKNHHLGALLDGSGPVTAYPVPDFAPYLPTGEPSAPARRVRVPLDSETQASLRAGERLLLSGRILTGRDAAHKRMVEALECGEPLPVDLRGQIIYYVGPIDPQGLEVVGSAGPTTAIRMDPYTPRLLREAGLSGAIGKGERGQATVEAFGAAGAVYMIATGGAAYLQSRTIKSVEVLAWPELGTEAIRAFEVQDFPVVVAVDSTGADLHREARQRWARPHFLSTEPQAQPAAGQLEGIDHESP